MERFVDKTAVVTGASAGIGRGLVKELIIRKINVVGLARRVEKMEELKTEFLAEPKVYVGKFYPLKCDISDVNDIREAFSWISKNIGLVSILINNAGVMKFTSLSEVDEEIYDNTFDTNVKGMMFCIKEAIALMNKTDPGSHIININSLAGHSFLNFGENLHFLYSITKHAVTALSAAFKREIARKNMGIKISSLSPGAVNTALTSELLALIPNDWEIQIEDVVRACIAILDTPPHILISELTISTVYQDK